MTAWTDDRNDTLRTLWGTGATGQQIATHMGGGLSRSAVLAQARRLKLPERPAGGPSGRYRVSAGDAHEQIDAMAADRNRPGHVRKAFASLGDDTTFSRWVKVKPEGPTQPRLLESPRAIAPRKLAHPAVAAGRSIFHRKGVVDPAKQPHVLVSGHANCKIGRDVRKGKLRGYWIYALSLEERATCPRTCHHWATCYGNNMPFARRMDHREPLALERAIIRDVHRLLAVRGRVGILVRLHALGDFYDQEYVDLWAKLLADHDRLACYGYTAWSPSSAIGAAIERVRQEYGDRFAIRWSNGGADQDCTLPVRTVDETVNAIVCPEQTGKTAGCGTCALCWTTRRNIAFLEH